MPAAWVERGKQNGADETQSRLKKKKPLSCTCAKSLRTITQKGKTAAQPQLLLRFHSWWALEIKTFFARRLRCRSQQPVWSNTAGTFILKPLQRHYIKTKSCYFPIKHLCAVLMNCSWLCGLTSDADTSQRKVRMALHLGRCKGYSLPPRNSTAALTLQDYSRLGGKRTNRRVQPLLLQRCYTDKPEGTHLFGNKQATQSHTRTRRLDFVFF